MKNIAIFASGTGSNARKILEHFQDHPSVCVKLLLSGNPKAPALEIARSFGVDALALDREGFASPDKVLPLLAGYPVHFIALAGFMWKIPEYLVRQCEGHIINIHPALLPKFGGKGMYGMHVHEAVLAAGETESGITVHWVNEQYDEGAIIFQARCPVFPEDSPADLAKRVQVLEHRFYPLIIEQLMENPGETRIISLLQSK